LSQVPSPNSSPRNDINKLDELHHIS
jgi:hypothetical protein